MSTSGKVVVEKSTVPVKAAQSVMQILKSNQSGQQHEVGSVWEFEEFGVFLGFCGGF